jgi:hypothetical protein
MITRFIPLLFLGAWLALVQPCPGGEFRPTGSLVTGRSGHTAILLPNGKVLVAGGYGSAGALAGAELYDPATSNWTATGDLVVARYFHTATLLPDGEVLVTGGLGSDFKPLAARNFTIRPPRLGP